MPEDALDVAMHVKDLHPVVELVRHHNVPPHGVHSHGAGPAELPNFVPHGAKGAQEAARLGEDLHRVCRPVRHDDLPAPPDGNVGGLHEVILPEAGARPVVADETAVVRQHLHLGVGRVAHHETAVGEEGDAGGRGGAEPRVCVVLVELEVLNNVKARVTPRVRLEALLVDVEKHVSREKLRRADHLDQLRHGELVELDTPQEGEHIGVPAPLSVGSAPPRCKLEPLDRALVSDHQIEGHRLPHALEARLGDLGEGGGGKGAARVEQLHLRGVGRNLSRAGGRRGIDVPRKVGLEGGNLVLIGEAPHLLPV
mmetsp:Transcript_18017/g.41684  ORF Transcript_18017/g.41684 Transcript_18017/m.41684 type:complete len:311 (-) Transcript_18017:1194-2126(-)